MSFNNSLVINALHASLATKNVGDILQFPDVDPVFSNGADVASAPVITNLTGIPLASYELRSRFIYMKYAFSVEALQFAGIFDDAVFEDKIRRHFQSGVSEYLGTITVPSTVYRSPSVNDVTFEFNTILGGTVKVARAYFNIRYWFKLP